MTNDQTRMTNECPTPDDQTRMTDSAFVIGHSDLIRHSGFGVRHFLHRRTLSTSFCTGQFSQEHALAQLGG
jgi:hypothetical protein